MILELAPISFEICFGKIEEFKFLKNIPKSFDRPSQICFWKVMIRIGLKWTSHFMGLKKKILVHFWQNWILARTRGLYQCWWWNIWCSILVSKIWFYASVCDILTQGVCIRGVKIVWTWHAWVSSRMNVEYVARVIAGVGAVGAFSTMVFEKIILIHRDLQPLVQRREDYLKIIGNLHPRS